MEGAIPEGLALICANCNTLYDLTVYPHSCPVCAGVYYVKLELTEVKKTLASTENV